MRSIAWVIWSGMALFPNEVVEFLREKHITTLMGNYDEAVGYALPESGARYAGSEQRGFDLATLRWTREVMTDQGKEYLQSLPLNHRETCKKRHLLFVHGSPRRINEYLFSDLPDASLDVVIRLAACDVLFAGHTHVPMVKRMRRTWVANPGSVGMPLDGDPRASYMVFSTGLSVRMDIRRISYDTSAAAAAVAKAGLTEEIGVLLTKGNPRSRHCYCIEGEYLSW